MCYDRTTDAYRGVTAAEGQSLASVGLANETLGLYQTYLERHPRDADAWADLAMYASMAQQPYVLCC